MGQLEKYLSLFDLDKDFNKDDLKNSYRTLSKVWHPDRFGNNEKLKRKAEEKFKEINNGHEFLKNYLKTKKRKSTTQKTHKKSSKSGSNNSQSEYKSYTEQKSNQKSKRKEYSYENKANSNVRNDEKGLSWTPILISAFLITFVLIGMFYNGNTPSDHTQSNQKPTNRTTVTSNNEENRNEIKDESEDKNSRDLKNYAGFEYYETALELEEQQEFKKSLSYLNRAIELSPDFSEAYEARGGVKYVLQKWRSGLKDYNKAIELNPNNEEAYVGRGITKSELGYSSNEICKDIIKAKKLGSDAPFVVYSDCFDE